MTLWGGRFEGKSDPLFRAFNDSLPVDWRLVQHDITGSIAWATALVDAGVLSREECDRIAASLREIAEEARTKPDAVRCSGEEDVHSWVESQLIARCGDLGKKLHTGRSRNDQVATDLRLWLRDEIDQRVREIADVHHALIDLAEREINTAFPGYTHLQRAQPILFAHWCLAYAEMFDRDADRFGEARQRTNVSPLGCGALAGTAYSIDREKLAHDLGFDRASSNSLDSVSDRDFVVDALAAASLCAVHLSRLAEDLFIYSSAEFGLIELPDAFTSGSSLMPQKKNPDALELIRGKCGRIIAAHHTLLITLKGLPLAYNKDMQEDKPPLFDAMDQLSMCLRVLPPLLEGVRVNRTKARAAAEGGYSNATDLADYLVSRGVPFREAHDQVGRMVRLAMTEDKKLEELSIEQMRTISPQIDDAVKQHLTIEASLNRRNALGGTARARVKSALDAAKSLDLTQRHT